MSAELAVQKVLNSLFRGDTALGALVGDSVYDRVPKERDYPYIHLADATSTDEDTGCSARREVFFDVHVWSRKVGKVEGLRIIGAIRDAVRGLDRSGDEITADDFTIAHIRVAGTRVFTDPDGLTTHGVVTIEALVDPNN